MRTRSLASAGARRTPRLRVFSVRLLSLLSVLFLLPASAQAAEFSGIVSERSADKWVKAVELFHQEHPGHRVTLRTPEQFARMNDREALQFIEDNDGLLLGAVFGDQVERITKLVHHGEAAGSRLVIALHGDLRLTKLSWLNGRQSFDGLKAKQKEELTRSLGAQSEWSAQLNRLTQKYPRQSAMARGASLLAGWRE